MARQRLVNLSAAIAAIVVFGFALGLMFPLLSLLMERQGISPEIIGYNNAMAPLGILMAGFVVPRLVRKFGAKTVVICAAWLVAGIILTYHFTPVFWWWFGLRILHGLAVSTLFSISEAWIVKFAAGAYRTRILALYTSMLALSFGGGPALIAYVGIDGFRPFVIGAVVLIVATIPMYLVREPPIVDEDSTAALSTFTFAPKAPILLMAVGLFAIIDAANLGFLPVYGVKKGLDQETAALILTAFIVGNTVFQLPIGWLADHHPKRKVMAGCAIVTAIASALLPVSFGTPLMWLVLLVCGAASAGIYTVALSELGERFSGHELVAGTASFATTWGLGAIFGALVAGWSFQAFGPDGLPLTIAAIFALFIGAIIIRQRLKTGMKSPFSISYGTGVVLVAAGALCWSFGGALIRLTHGIDAWQIIFYRSSTLGLCMMGWLILQHGRHLLLAFRQAGLNAIVAGFAVGMAGLTFITSLFYTTVAQSIFMVGLSPFMSALLGLWILRERVSATTWIAMAVALAGMVIILTGASGSGSAIGTAMAIYSAFCFSCYAVLLRWGQHTEMTVALVWNAIFLVAASAIILTVPTGLRAMTPAPFAIGWSNFLACLALGSVQVTLGLALFTFGSRAVPAAQLALIALVEPTLSPLWAWLVADEVPPLVTFVGGAVILGAIAFQALVRVRRMSVA